MTLSKIAASKLYFLFDEVLNTLEILLTTSKQVILCISTCYDI